MGSLSSCFFPSVPPHSRLVTRLRFISGDESVGALIAQRQRQRQPIINRDKLLLNFISAICFCAWFMPAVKLSVFGLFPPRVCSFFLLCASPVNIFRLSPNQTSLLTICARVPSRRHPSQSTSLNAARWWTKLASPDIRCCINRFLALPGPPHPLSFDSFVRANKCTERTNHGLGARSAKGTSRLCLFVRWNVINGPDVKQLLAVTKCTGASMHRKGEAKSGREQRERNGEMKELIKMKRNKWNGEWTVFPFPFSRSKSIPFFIFFFVAVVVAVAVVRQWLRLQQTFIPLYRSCTAIEIVVVLRRRPLLILFLVCLPILLRHCRRIDEIKLLWRLNAIPSAEYANRMVKISLETLASPNWRWKIKHFSFVILIIGYRRARLVRAVFRRSRCAAVVWPAQPFLTHIEHSFIAHHPMEVDGLRSKLTSIGSEYSFCVQRLRLSRRSGGETWILWINSLSWYRWMHFGWDN